MENPDALNDVRYLREVVDKTLPPAANRHWPVTLAWGLIIGIGYTACSILALAGKINLIPWVMPGVIFLIGWPVQRWLARAIRAGAEKNGRRPQVRRDLLFLWLSIVAIGFLWTGWLVASGAIANDWFLLLFIWCSLHFVGSVMNGVLLSREWFWSAGLLFAVLTAAAFGGDHFYWMLGAGIPGSYLLAGILGYRNARRLLA